MKEYKCKGCGEEKVIETAEEQEYIWKDTLSPEQLADYHSKKSSGVSAHNDLLWWEDVVWDGDITEVVTVKDWWMYNDEISMQEAEKQISTANTNENNQ